MFLLSRRPKYQLQLYGKLPLAKDYLRIGCSKGAGLALKDWLDQAFSMQLASGSETHRLARPCRFLLGSETADPIIGCLWDSTDAGGLRSFPFALFVDVRRQQALQDLERGLDVEDCAWRELEEIRAQLDGFGDARELLSALRGRLLSPSDGSRAGSDIRFDEWVSSLWPRSGVEGLRRVFATAEREAAYPERPLSLPLSPRFDAAVQVASWAGALRALNWLDAKELPNLLFTMPAASAVATPGGEPRLLCLRRPLQPSDATLLAVQPLSQAAEPTVDQETVSEPPSSGAITQPAGTAGPDPESSREDGSLSQGLRSTALRFVAAATTRRER